MASALPPKLPGSIDRSATSLALDTDVPTPARSAGAAADTGPQSAEDPPLKDVALRIRGTARMEVRGRRHRRRRESREEGCEATLPEASGEIPAPKRPRLAEESDASAESTKPEGAVLREEEIARWVGLAPPTAHAAFSNGVEVMCARLARQPLAKLRTAVQQLGRRRASGDRDVEVLDWMEGFLVSMLALDFGVQFKMSLECFSSSVTLSSAVRIQPSISRNAPLPLRISAGRAAAAAGIHPYADVGELFLELLYQDLPEMLLRDAAVAQVEVVSQAAERERLMVKSGEDPILQAALQASMQAVGVEGAQAAREAVSKAVETAEQAGRLTKEEAAELRNTLELEINLEFGSRHEDAALEGYEAQIGTRTYGQQHRVKVAMPRGGVSEALARVFPAEGSGSRSRIEAQAAEASTAAGGPPADTSDVFFYLTGFTDAIVDLPRQGERAAGEAASETLVVEVKHRMGKIQDPPNIYDVVQLCSYCRVLGTQRGDLVQCLRKDSNVAGGNEHVLHVSRLDFSEGSEHRTGWDKYVLPGLYEITRAVYAARADENTRLQLLKITDPKERIAFVGHLCPHLGR